MNAIITMILMIVIGLFYVGIFAGIDKVTDVYHGTDHTVHHYHMVKVYNDK